MDTKKKSNIVNKIFVILIFMFIALYIIAKNGYINRINYKNTLYTEKEINEFEDKISKGEEIDINQYLKNDIKYNNTFSDTGLQVSKSIEKYSKKAFSYFETIFNYLFK